jgi:2-polyprenyl-3-methyl-5-hydroxy-6-metoxy-1,4-benzoquinol methylase
MKNIFSEQYFKSVNYVNYLEREEKYKKLAKELMLFLENASLINKSNSILDYGCAVGFLTKSIFDLGYKNIYGVDISDWAIKKAKKYNLTFSKKINKQSDIMIVLDVFEHMTDADIKKSLKKTNPNIIICRIPVCKNIGENFYLEVSRKDFTHINCKTKNEWKSFFKKNGYQFCLHLNLNTIYDSNGVFCAVFIK